MKIEIELLILFWIKKMNLFLLMKNYLLFSLILHLERVGINGAEDQVTNERFSFVDEDEFIRFYKRLFHRLKYKTIYKSNINNEEYIKDCIYTINENMSIFKNRRNLKLTTAEVIHRQYGNVELEENTSDTINDGEDLFVEEKSNMQLANLLTRKGK